MKLYRGDPAIRSPDPMDFPICGLGRLPRGTDQKWSFPMNQPMLNHKDRTYRGDSLVKLEKFDPKPFRRAIKRDRLVRIVLVSITLASIVAVALFALWQVSADASQPTLGSFSAQSCQEDEIITFSIDDGRRTAFECAAFDDLVGNYLAQRVANGYGNQTLAEFVEWQS